MIDQRVRELVPADADPARDLVHATLGSSRHARRVLEQLEVALSGADVECVALVLAEQDKTPLRAMVLFGPLAGASDVVKLHAIVGVNADAIVSLVNGLMLEPSVRVARMLVCEVADDEACAAAAAALFACAFAREGRVDDFFADGVSLDLMVRRGG